MMDMFNDLVSQKHEKAEADKPKLDGLVYDARQEIHQIAEHVEEKAPDVWDKVISPKLDDIRNADIVRKAAEKIDLIFNAQSVENVKNAVLSAPERITELCKNASLDGTVLIASYYTACECAVMDIIEDLNIGDKIELGLRKVYSSSDVAAKICDRYGIVPDETGDVIEEKIDGFVDLTLNAGKAALYVSMRVAGGTMRVFDNALRGAESVAEYCKGNPETAKALISANNVDAWCEYIDEVFDVSDLTKSIGQIADTVGNFATGLGLTIISIGTIGSLVKIATATEISAIRKCARSVAAVAGATVLSVGAFGEKLANNVEKTGDFSEKELVSAFVRGIVNAVALCTSAVLTVKIDQYFHSATDLGRKIISSVGEDKELGKKVLGIVYSGTMGAVNSGVFFSSDEISKVTDYVTHIEGDYNLAKELLKGLGTVALSAALATATYVIPDAIKNKLAEHFGWNSRNTDYFRDMYDEISTKIVFEDYYNDVIKYAAYPYTIPERKIKYSDLRKLAPEENANMADEFESIKSDLIHQWEEIHDCPWPTYKEDVYSSNGKLIRKAGEKYDAHHIIPKSMGGTNDVSNITPMHADSHYDRQGIHATNSNYSQLDRILKGALV